MKKNKMPKKKFKTAIHMMTADIFLVIDVLTVVDRSFLFSHNEEQTWRQSVGQS